MAAAAVADAHIRKRQFEPSIDSFFSRGDAGSDRPHKLTSPLSPPLPAATQASLLSVGMRVRESVPEGYKTHKTLGADGFPFPSTAPAVQATTQRPAYSPQSTRELTPFCGIHKTGGLEQQASSWTPPSSAPAAFFNNGDYDNDLNMPALSMSQNTIRSTQDSFMSNFGSGATKKRAYEDEIEDDLDAYFDQVESADAMMERPIAQARSLRQQPAPKERFVFMSGPDDFEEASFLSPMEVEEQM